MAKRWSKKTLLIKLEAIAGTAENLAAADAVLGINVERTPLAGETVSRELERPFFGGQDQEHTNVHTLYSFDVEVAGSGALANAPAWGRLLQACGMAETLTAAPGAWAAVTAYGLDDKVAKGGKFYNSRQANNTGNDPANGQLRVLGGDRQPRRRGVQADHRQREVRSPSGSTSTACSRSPPAAAARSP